MSKNRIKKTQITIVNREQAEAAMNELALAENNCRRAITERDELLLSITKDYQAKIELCKKAVIERTEALHAWAYLNPSLFEKKKSLDLGTGTIGFRTGTPKLSLLNRKWNWDLVLEAVKSKRWHIFVRTKEEVDKEKMLAHANAKPVNHELDTVGVKVVQDESFFIEPKLTDTDARQTVAA